MHEEAVVYDGDPREGVPRRLYVGSYSRAWWWARYQARAQCGFRKPKEVWLRTWDCGLVIRFNKGTGDPDIYHRNEGRSKGLWLLGLSEAFRRWSAVAAHREANPR